MSIHSSLSLGWKSKPHKVASCHQRSRQAAVPLTGSVLEAWGADVGLVEGMCGIKHFWRWRRGCQDGAERFMGAQHRGKVLHLLRQLLDLPAQGSVLPLQVFTLLRRQKHRGFLSSGATGMSWGHGGRSPVPLCPAEFPELHISGKFGTEPRLGKPPARPCAGAMLVAPATLPGPSLREVTMAMARSRPGFLTPSHTHTPLAASRAARPAGGGRAE